MSEIELEQTYNKGYADGVRDFAKRIRERDRTWSISEIEAELLSKSEVENDKSNGDM